MRLPDAKADEARGHQSKDDKLVSDQRSARERRNHRRHQSGCREEDDVKLWMPEKQEQVLPKHRIAAARRIEEGTDQRQLQPQQQGAQVDRMTVMTGKDVEVRETKGSVWK